MNRKVVGLFRTRSAMQKAGDVYQKLIVLCDARGFTPEDTDTLISMMLSSRQQQFKTEEERKRIAEELLMVAELMTEHQVIMTDQGDDDPGPEVA